jgi:hypothetical protein
VRYTVEYFPVDNARYLYKRSKFVKNEHARYGVCVRHQVYIIYTSKGMLKKFGVRVIHRCVLSTRKYGICSIAVMLGFLMV